MRDKKIHSRLLEKKAKGEKSFAILIDPDKAVENHLERLVKESIKYHVDYFFVGGSLITSPAFTETIAYLKKNCTISVIIFPGNNIHIDEQADALLFLSLISGRNPEFLIGQQVIAAPRLRYSNLEILPTGYILMDGGKPTTVSYISNTAPVPSDKPEIAAVTALAGELMGMQFIYLDSGSGALEPVSIETIRKVHQWVECPIIVGGGIDTPEKAKACWEAGADLVVIGNAIEKNPELIGALQSYKSKLLV
jgi:phosphoglycerol geranylgeranyltransferase